MDLCWRDWELRQRFLIFEKSRLISQWRESFVLLKIKQEGCNGAGM